jgi:hypothetical protein
MSATWRIGAVTSLPAEVARGVLGTLLALDGLRRPPMHLVVGNRPFDDPSEERLFRFMAPGGVGDLDDGAVQFEPPKPKTPTQHPELEDEDKRNLEPPQDPPPTIPSPRPDTPAPEDDEVRGGE